MIEPVDFRLSTLLAYYGVKNERPGETQMPALRCGDEKMEGPRKLHMGRTLFICLLQRRMFLLCTGLGTHEKNAECDRLIQAQS